jgi:hypothetical protein
MSVTSGSHAIETLAIHAGQPADPTHGAVMQPIVLASTFAQPEPAKPLRFDYSRSGNPTRAALEQCLAALEGGSTGFAFGSGCAAATTLLHTLRPGDHVVSGDDVYGGTFRIFDKVMGPLGIAASFVDLREPERLQAALTPRTRLLSSRLRRRQYGAQCVLEFVEIGAEEAQHGALLRRNLFGHGGRELVALRVRQHGQGIGSGRQRACACLAPGINRGRGSGASAVVGRVGSVHPGAGHDGRGQGSERASLSRLGRLARARNIPLIVDLSLQGPANPVLRAFAICERIVTEHPLAIEA